VTAHKPCPYIRLEEVPCRSFHLLEGRLWPTAWIDRAQGCSRQLLSSGTLTLDATANFRLARSPDTISPVPKSDVLQTPN
jgi:hypothetical protein